MENIQQNFDTLGDYASNKYWQTTQEKQISVRVNATEFTAGKTSLNRNGGRLQRCEGSHFSYSKLALLAEQWTHVMQECHMWQQIFSFILTNADKNIQNLHEHITNKYQMNHGQLVLKQIPINKIDVREHTWSNCQICNTS